MEETRKGSIVLKHYGFKKCKAFKEMHSISWTRNSFGISLFLEQNAKTKFCAQKNRQSDFFCEFF